MKKIYSILASALLLLSAPTLNASAADKPTHDVRAFNHGVNLTDGSSSLKKRVPNSLGKLNLSQAPLYGDILTSGRGTLKNYEVSAYSYFDYQGYILNYFYDGMVGCVYFDSPTNTVYMKNPISYTITNTYIKGTYTDTSLSFPMPQVIYEEDGAFYYVHRMVKNKEQSKNYKPVFEIDDSKPISYDIAEDGTITFAEAGEDYIIGMTDADGNWICYGDHDITYEPFTKQKLTTHTITPDVYNSLHTWTIDKGIESQVVKACEHNGKFYIEGLNLYELDAVIVGDVDGDVVTFPSGQYVGIQDDYNYYLYFYALSFDQKYSAFDEDYYTVYNIEDEAVFDFDREKCTLTCRNDAFAIVGGEVGKPDAIEIFSIYDDYILEHVPEDISLMPKEAYDLQLDIGFYESILNFTFDGKNVDGWPLDFDRLFYRIYFDNEIFVMTPFDYVTLEEDRTDIGYSEIIYDQNGMADVYYFRGDRYIYFYFEAENPGVQTVYKADDREYCSKIVYLDPTSVHNIINDKTVVSTTYTDLSGRTVQHPTTGLYLKTVRYSDGSHVTTKSHINY